LGHNQAIPRFGQAFALAAAFVAALALGGCGGVEFQGKVFDYMGISGERQEADVKMSERPPLLLPPNLKNLPPPGTGVTTAIAREDWPDDPEKVRKRVAKEEAARKAKKAAEADPTNPYAGKPNLLDKVLGRTKEEEEPIADVPEPDPSDKQPEDSAVASSGPKALSPHVPQDPLPERPETGTATPESYTGMSNPAGNSAP
jgi:hypothetical protein